MEDNRNALDLAKNLLDNGYTDVRFFDDLSYHPTVQKLITNQSLINKNQIALVCSTQNPAIINQNGYPNLAQQTINSGFQFQSNQVITPISSSSVSPQLLPPMDPNTYLHHMYTQAPPVQTIPNLTVMPMPTPMPMKKIQMSQMNHLLNGVGSPAPYRRKETPLPEEIVNCRKCTAQVNITRYSNLMTHVRKHCELKMFQCPECTFSSNAGQKVSHHMRSLHKLLGEPITRTHQEIQPVLEQLTNDCFPTYSEQLERVRAIHTNRIGTLKMRKRKSLWDDGVLLQPTTALPVINPQPINSMSYRCYDCRKHVQCVIGTELSPDGSLITHLRVHHTLECMPYKCAACGYLNPTEWKIRRHIINRHPENACDVEVTQLKTPNWTLFLSKFFAELTDILPDDEEDLACQQLEDKNLDPLLKDLISKIDKKSIINEMLGFEAPKMPKIRRKNQNPVKIHQNPVPEIQKPSTTAEVVIQNQMPPKDSEIIIQNPPKDSEFQNPPKHSETIIQNPPKASEIQNPTEIQNFMKAFESKIQNPSGIQNLIKNLESKNSEPKIQNPPRIQEPFWIQSLPLSSESGIQNPVKEPEPRPESGGQESFWIQNLPLSSESQKNPVPESEAIIQKPRKSTLYVPIIDPNVITID